MDQRSGRRCQGEDHRHQGGLSLGAQGRLDAAEPFGRNRAPADPPEDGIRLVGGLQETDPPT
jgi:hypothetical protein